MKGLVLLVHERMLFALLRASLNQREVETDLFQGVSSDDWKECYQLAARQGVMALAWDGVLKLPSELMPPKALKLAWGLAVEAYEKKYERYCRTLDKLVSYYRDHGIVTVQMKGVGLSMLYPIPSHREGGDIDIYTFSQDHTKMTDAEANQLADRLMEEQGIEVDMHSHKHSNFFYKGIPIENHKTFLDVQWYKQAPQVEQILQRLLEPQPALLSAGKYRCLVPSSEFNCLFVAFHAAQHYGSGLALHHLCDWVVLLNNYGLQLPDEITDVKLRQGINTFTRLCNEYLGTSEKIVGSELSAEVMLESILHPKFVLVDIPVKEPLKVFLYKARRFVYMHRLNNSILGWPMWGRIREMIFNHLRHPDRIFRISTD